MTLEQIKYPSSVNRGYSLHVKPTGYAGRTWFGIHPLSIEAIHSTPSEQASTRRAPWSIHPLSIEAIHSTLSSVVLFGSSCNVSILCQSRLFTPLTRCTHVWHRTSSIHPLSIEAIHSTFGCPHFRGPRLPVSILCQSRLFTPPRG